MFKTLPNILSLARVAIIPLIALMILVPGKFAAWTALILFTIACITDYLDGYLARSMQEVSDFGKFIDPIADKLLVATVLFVLVAANKITGMSILPALIILLREIVVSGLREFLATIHVRLPVSKMAKWKTSVQMIALGFLIIGDSAPWTIPGHSIGLLGIWVAAIITVITAWDYLYEGVLKILNNTRSTGSTTIDNDDA
jgi:cardiolipin synthase